MEFAYTVTESDYITAWKLRRMGGARTVKTIAFWAIILMCLIGVWAIVTHGHADRPAAPVPSTPDTHGSMMGNVLPFVFILALWIYMLSRLGPRTIRTLYRKDPLMQGQFTVKVTSEWLDTTNTAGYASQARWASINPGGRQRTSSCFSWRPAAFLFLSFRDCRKRSETICAES